MASNVKSLPTVQLAYSVRWYKHSEITYREHNGEDMLSYEHVIHIVIYCNIFNKTFISSNCWLSLQELDHMAN